ncbi:MAG: AAA-like domain-containing protein [Verrucomicrobia bacterium]|nr:AAA-like domain-containing protein [Verrucomicrobiota bacterium]
MNALENGFYVTGGTLRHDSPSYVERQADQALLDGLLKGEFCYVLTSRQMGKSSLMVRTATKLREREIKAIALDLSAIGQNLTPEQWYDGLFLRMGEQLRLEDELEDFWNNNLRLSPVQRLFSAIRDVVLAQTAAALVIFVDELDVVRSLPFSTDEFFAAIRECYNRRTEDPEFNRITFCLLGVATPSDLIRDIRTTPFNIGKRIELTDFTPAEAAPLAKGLAGANPSLSPDQLAHLLERILYWTEGHPYLTQRLCRATAGANSNPATFCQPLDPVRLIDSICEDLFFSNRARDRDDNLIFVRERILRSDVDRISLLDLYLRMRRGKYVLDDETNPLVGVLRLSGIAKAEHDRLRERNRIYHQVFDREWVQSNMPDAELRRQRAAFLRGVLRTTAIAAVVVAAMTFMVITAVEQTKKAQQALALSNFSQAQARRASGLSGQRHASLEALKLARRYHTNEAMLRDEAIACLALTDLQESAPKGYPLTRSNVFALDWDLRVAAEAGPDGSITLREVETNRVLRVLGASGWQIQQLHLSPAEPFLAVFARHGSEESVQVWDWKVGKLLLAAEHGIHDRAIDFSRDGRKLAVGQRNGLVSVYSLPSGTLAHTLELKLDSQFPRAPQVVRFDPTGRLLAEACSDDLRVQIWNLESRDRVASLYHRDRAYDVSWHPRGDVLAVACGDAFVYLWAKNHPDAAVGTHLGYKRATGSFTGNAQTDWLGPKLLAGHESAVSSVAFNQRGTRLASLGRDETIRLWIPETDKHLIHRLAGELSGRLQFTRDDQRLLAIAGHATNVHMWKVLDGEYRVLAGRNSPFDHFRTIDFDPEERLLAGVSGEQATIWDLPSGHELSVLRLTNVQAAYFGGGGRHLVASTPSGLLEYPLSARASEASPGFEPGTIRVITHFPEELGAMALSQEGNAAAIVHQAEVLVGSLEHPDRFQVLSAGRHYSRLAIHPKSVWLAAAQKETSTLDLWHLSQNPMVRAPTGIPSSEFFAFSPDGRWLVVCWAGEFQFYRIGAWEAPRFAIKRTTASSLHAPMAFTKDGAIVAIASSRHTIQLLNLPNTEANETKVIATLQSPDRSPLEILVFSPRNRWLAAATKDQTVQLWNLPLLRAGLAELNLAGGWPDSP